MYGKQLRCQNITVNVLKFKTLYSVCFSLNFAFYTVVS